MRTILHTFTLFGLTFSTVLSPLTAMAETSATDTVAAEQKTKAARKLLEKRNFEEALKLFKEAYAINPKVDYLYDIGVTLNALGRHKKALEYFDLLVEEAQKTATPEVVVEALKQQKELRRKLGTIEIISNQDRAQVTIDGMAQGETPLRSLAFDKGAHMVIVTKDGFAPFTKTVQLYEGQVEKVQVLLAPSAAPSTVRATDDVVTDVTPPAPSESDAPAPTNVPLEKPASAPSADTTGIDLNASVGLSIWSGVKSSPGPSLAVGLRGAYRVLRMGDVEAAAGLRFAYAGFSETIAGKDASNKFWSFLASPSIRYHLLPNKASLRFEANVGLTVLSGLAPGSSLLQPQAENVNGAAAMLELRPLLAFEYHLARNWFVTAHVAYATSFTPSLYSSSTISRVDLGVGVGYQL